MRRVRRIARRRYRRSVYRRFRRGYRNSVSRFGFSQNKVVTMKWFGMQAFTLSTGGMGHGTTIRMNSPFDPWNAITGTFNLTAGGYTMYSQMYHYYTVMSSRLIATISYNRVLNTNKATEGTTSYANAYTIQVPIRWGIKLDDDADISSYTSTGWHAIVCDPDTKWRTFYPNTIGAGHQRLVVRYNPHKYFGIRDTRDKSDVIGAAMGSNPTKVCYACPFWQILDEASAYEGSVYFSVDYKLYMRVRLTEPYDIGTLPSNMGLIEE